MGHSCFGFQRAARRLGSQISDRRFGHPTRTAGMGEWPRALQILQRNRTSPLRSIDDEVLLEWAHAKPTTRFLLLAESIGAWRPQTTVDDKDDLRVRGQRVEWTPAVRRLVHEAPDPVEVLNVLGRRFRPSNWSGSLADIYETRLPLLEAFENDSDARISHWARDQIPKFKDEIEKVRIMEALEDRQRDEKFEWRGKGFHAGSISGPNFGAQFAFKSRETAYRLAVRR